MAKRKSIAIIYTNDENWIGGTYYIQNLIAAFLKLPENEKPHVLLLSKTKEEFEQVEKTGYSYLTWQQLEFVEPGLSIVKRFINKTMKMLNGYDRFAFPLMLELKNVTAIFPAPIGLKAQPLLKKIYWIPDFQEKYYPTFFSKTEIKNRIQNHRLMASSEDTVVFSSRQAMNDFKDSFPKHHCKTAILKFAVTHPEFAVGSIKDVLAKYGINKSFFIAPNQFWKHKNQSVLVEAAKILKRKKQLDFEIVFTGKEHDYRNPDYAENLKKKVIESGLQHEVKFLGFIDRADQLQLIKESIALVQPSLFEGWSTVLEDGKALNKFIIASDIAVHREQLTSNAVFFDAENARQLADLLVKKKSKKLVPINYNKNIYLFATQFLKIIQD